MGILSVMARPSQSTDKTESWLLHGKSALLSAFGTQAEQDFANVLRSTPEHPEALQGLLTSWLLQGKSDQVIEYYDESSPTLQEQLREFLWISLSMQVGHLSADGYALWIQLPAQNPDRLQGLRDLSKDFSKCGALSIDWANAALESYQIKEAERALKQIRDAQPRLPEKEIARIYAKRDALLLNENPEILALLSETSTIIDPVERFERLEPVAQQWMEFPALQREAGLALLEANRPTDAIRYLNRSVDANPYWLNAWIELGVASLQAGRLVRAKEALIRAHHLSQTTWLQELSDKLHDRLEEAPYLAQVEIANNRIEAGDFPSAIEHLHNAIRKTPDASNLRWKIGETYLSLQEHKQAASYLRSAWADALEAQKELSFEQLAVLELAVHQYIIDLLLESNTEDAIDLLEEMLSANQTFELLREDLSIAQKIHAGTLPLQAFMWYEKSRRKIAKQHATCIDWLNKAIELSPHFSEALLTRSVLSAERGHLDESEQDLQRMMQSSGFEAPGLFHMAGIMFLRQNINAAKALWTECLEKGQSPWSKRSGANLYTIGQNKPAQLFLAWLPTHRRIINFTPEAKAQITSTGPKKEKKESLFEISSSAELTAANTEEVPIELQILAEEVPRFSDLAPSISSLAVPEDPLAFLSGDEFEGVPSPTDENEEFNFPKEAPLPSFLDQEISEEESEEGWSLSMESELDSSFEPNEPPVSSEPLFDITPKVELQAEFPFDIVQERAAENVPTLSQVIPGTEKEPEIIYDSPSSPLFTQTPELFPLELDGEPKAALDTPPLSSAPLTPVPPAFKAPTQEKDELPPPPAFMFRSKPETKDELPPSPVFVLQPKSETTELAPLPTPPTSPVPEKKPEAPNLMGGLFGGDDDLSSFLDEAFMSLDNIEEKKEE